MSGINVFYHVWQGEGWEILFQQQIMSLYTSGLYDASDGVYICVNGRFRLPFDLSKFHVRYNQNQTNEADTLKELWDLCSLLPNQKVLYFHTKGLSYNNSLGRRNVDGWRHYLEYYNIHRWKDCIEKLKTYDVVGTEWDSKPNLYIGYKNQVLALKNAGIYVGNFWWSNSEYIKTLDPNYLYKYNAPQVIEGFPEHILENLTEDDKKQLLRFNSELWIGSNNPKHFSFKEFKVAFYDTNILYKLEEFQ